jgi:ATP-binding cassette subfamily A (ABC1) protein 3
MDETEALCSKIGIMVNGELKCLGSLQHLKSRYGDGYTLIAKVSLGNGDNDEKINQSNQHKKINEFIEFVLSKFSDGKSKLKESRDGFINIHINENSTTALSKIFSLIESVKVKFSIEFYVVTQTKLEQIFLNFASKQIDPETRIIKSKGLLC